MEYPIPETKVNYETALLAKEAGFNEVCHHHFGTDGTEFDSRNPEGAKNSKWVKCVARPTQSHLQKWMRKKHRMHVFCVKNDEGLPYYDVCVIKTGINYRSDEPECVYEEALDIGLLVGLKMILKDKEAKSA